jgi:hypothetical protein
MIPSTYCVAAVFDSFPLPLELLFQGVGRSG